MFDKLYKKYLKKMGINNNPYNYLELMMAEGLIPGYIANPVHLKTKSFLSGRSINFAALSGIDYNFFDLLEDAGAMIKFPAKRTFNTQAILHEMAEMLAGAANDNKGKSLYSSPSKAA